MPSRRSSTTIIGDIIQGRGMQQGRKAAYTLGPSTKEASVHRPFNTWGNGKSTRPKLIVRNLHRNKEEVINDIAHKINQRNYQELDFFLDDEAFTEESLYLLIDKLNHKGLKFLLDKKKVECSPGNIKTALGNFLKSSTDDEFQKLWLLVTETTVGVNGTEEICRLLKELQSKDLIKYEHLVKAAGNAGFIKTFIKRHAVLSDANSSAHYLYAFWEDLEMIEFIIKFQETRIAYQVLERATKELAACSLDEANQTAQEALSANISRRFAASNSTSKRGSTYSESSGNSEDPIVEYQTKLKRLKTLINCEHLQRTNNENAINAVFDHCDDDFIRNFIDEAVDYGNSRVHCLRKSLNNPKLFCYLTTKSFVNDLVVEREYSALLTEFIDKYCSLAKDKKASRKEITSARNKVQLLLDWKIESLPNHKRPDLPHKLIETGDSELVIKYLDKYADAAKTRINEDKNPYYLYKLGLCIAEVFCWITIFPKAHRMAKGDKLMQTVIAGKAWPEGHYDSLLHSAAKITDLGKAREMMNLLKTRCPDLLLVRNIEGKTAEALLNARETINPQTREHNGKANTAKSERTKTIECVSAQASRGSNPALQP